MAFHSNPHLGIFLFLGAPFKNCCVSLFHKLVIFLVMNPNCGDLSPILTSLHFDTLHSGENQPNAAGNPKYVDPSPFWPADPLSPPSRSMVPWSAKLTKSSQMIADMGGKPIQMVPHIYRYHPVEMCPMSPFETSVKFLMRKYGWKWKYIKKAQIASDQSLNLAPFVAAPLDRGLGN